MFIDRNKGTCMFIVFNSRFKLYEEINKVNRPV